LAKRRISLQYSGFAVFTARLIGIVTGFAFTMMVARSAVRTPTVDEYGIWGNLNMILIPYFTLLSGVIPFWTMRFVAREKEGAVKAGILASTIIAVIAAIVYMALVPIIASMFQAEAYILLYSIAAAQIIEVYLIAGLEACLQAQRPQAVAYGFLVGEVIKLLLGFVFMIELQQSLAGAMLSIVIGFAVKMAFYFKLVLKELRQSTVLSYIKEWVKGSTFNMYSMVGDRVAALVFVMLSLYGGSIATGYYTASALVATIVTYSGLLAYALQPKLLAEGNLEDATTSLKMVLMFAIPMTAGIIALSGSYLIIQDKTYNVATPVIMILAVDGLISTVSSLYTYVLYGIEKVDEKATIPFRQVVKSRLFVAFSLTYTHSAITLPATFFALSNFAKNQPLLVATYVTAINTVGHLLMFIVLYIILRRAVKVRIPWKNIAKYSFSSAVMATFLFVIPRPTTTFLTFGLTAIGGIIYLALLMAIDKEARILAVTVWQKAKSKIA
jgi:O-antigen/teichoic acid export membrane protein